MPKPTTTSEKNTRSDPNHRLGLLGLELNSVPCSECKTECLSEFVGTYLLVLIGPGTVVVVSQVPNLNFLIALTIVAFSFGCTVAAIVWSLGKYSAHINPAITVAHAFAGMTHRRLLIPYVGFQILGGLFAGLTLRLIFQDSNSAAYFGSTKLATGVAPLAGIVLEAAGTLSLSFVVLGTATYIRASKDQALLVGSTLFVLILLIGPLTGASFNPARSLGPSLASSFFTNQYVFLVGPLSGGIVGAFLFKAVKDYARGKDGREEHTLCVC